MNRDAWNNRPTTVTVLTLCEHCNRLRDDVEQRDLGVWFRVWFRSCKPCALARQKEMLAFAESVC